MGPENQFSVKLEDIKQDEVNEDDIPLVLLNGNNDYDSNSVNDNHDLDSNSVFESGDMLVSTFYF